MEKQPVGFALRDKGQRGIEVVPDTTPDFKMTFPNSLKDPIEVALAGGKKIQISQQSQTNFNKISPGQIEKTKNNKTLLETMQRLPIFVAYQTVDKRKTVLYSYQKPSEEQKQWLFKNWILFDFPTDGKEAEAFEIRNAQVVIDDNGNAQVYYIDKKELSNKLPDFIIPRPYFLDKNGNKTNLAWNFDQEKKLLSVAFSVAVESYPIALDPSVLQQNATVAAFSGKSLEPPTLDQTPTAFSFTNQTGVSPTSTITSDAVTIAGINTVVTATCSGCTAIAKNGVWDGTSVGGFGAGDTLAIRLTSSGALSTTASATVTVGEYAVPVWSVVTRAFFCGGDTIADADNNTYNTLLVGTQCWMATNLRVGTRIAGASNQTNNSTIEKYCYADNDANCTTYGALYQWEEAMQYLTTEGARGICPAGWHIPTDSNWKTLEMQLGMTQAQADATGWRGTDQGTKLKEGGSSGLNFPLAGYRDTDGTFSTLSTYAYVWSSSQGAASAWSRYLNSGYAAVNRDAVSKAYGFSVRCLKD